jgi:uncharacterized protein
MTRPSGGISRSSAALALAIVIPAPSIGALASFWLFPGPVGVAIYALGKGVLYLTPALWSRFVDGEPWSFSPPSRRGWGAAIGFGLLVSAAILALWLAIGDAAFDLDRFRGILTENGLATPERFMLAAAWLSFVNALLEEYVFRWFITTRIDAALPGDAASGGRRNGLVVALSALAFTLHHIIVLAHYLPPVMTALACIGILVGGAFWSWLYRHAGSLWPAYVSHAIVDIAVMTVGYLTLF